MIPNRRFREEPMNAKEAIEWLKTHRYIWYQAPMDHTPHKLYCTSRLKLWKRSPDRFAVSVEVFDGCGGSYRLQVDNTHLDRLRLPNPLWHHGVSAELHHVDYVGYPHTVVMSQSNGYHFRTSVSKAIAWCKREKMELTVTRWYRGKKRVRVLVPAVPPISGEHTFSR